MCAKRPELVELRDLYGSIGSWKRYLRAWERSFDTECGLDAAALIAYVKLCIDNDLQDKIDGRLTLYRDAVNHELAENLKLK